MDLLIDTQALVWLGSRPSNVPAAVLEAVRAPRNRNLLSSVTAYEFVDLNRRGRFGADLPLSGIIPILDIEVLVYPADAWRIADLLPDIHRDPVDRMTVAHAIHADLILVTADATMRTYPVRTLW